MTTIRTRASSLSLQPSSLFSAQSFASSRATTAPSVHSAGSDGSSIFRLPRRKPKQRKSSPVRDKPPKYHSSGRGGAGNMRRRSPERSASPSHDALQGVPSSSLGRLTVPFGGVSNTSRLSVTRPDREDAIGSAAGRESTLSPTKKTASSGRGGVGNIASQKQTAHPPVDLSRLPQTASIVTSHEQTMRTYEQDLIAASAASRQAQKGGGRGGMGNILKLRKNKKKNKKDKTEPPSGVDEILPVDSPGPAFERASFEQDAPAILPVASSLDVTRNRHNDTSLSAPFTEFEQVPDEPWSKQQGQQAGVYADGFSSSALSTTIPSSFSGPLSPISSNGSLPTTPTLPDALLNWQWPSPPGKRMDDDADLAVDDEVVRRLRNNHLSSTSVGDLRHRHAHHAAQADAEDKRSSRHPQGGRCTERPNALVAEERRREAQLRERLRRMRLAAPPHPPPLTPIPMPPLPSAPSAMPRQMVSGDSLRLEP